MLYDNVYDLRHLSRAFLQANPDIIDQLANDALSRHKAWPRAADSPLNRRPLAGLDSHRGVTETVRPDHPTLWEPAEQSLLDDDDPALLSLFWEAMHGFSLFTARIFAAAVDFGPFRRLLDVGGGSAAYAIELCRHYAHLRATVYDLPIALMVAADRVVQAGLADRIQTVAGYVFADEPLPVGHDVILLSRVLRDWSEATNRELLHKCYRALPSGGALIIEDMLVHDEPIGLTPGASRHRNMPMATEERIPTSAEYRAWLTDLGFRVTQTVWFDAPDTNGAVLGYKP